MSGPCYVVKLGGALVSRDSGTGPWLRFDIVHARARELAGVDGALVLVHGTGAFGKPPAVNYAYMGGKLPANRAAIVAEVELHLAKYEVQFDEALLGAGLNPFRVSASAIMRGTPDGCQLVEPRIVRELLGREAITPVIGGSLVPDDDGFSVCSSDDIAVDLALALDADALVFATRAHGVYRDFGHSESIFESLCAADIESLTRACPDEQDVSGGMQAKLKASLRAAANGVQVHVVDGRTPGNLAATLAGRPLSGTRITADRAGGC